MTTFTKLHSAGHRVRLLHGVAAQETVKGWIDPALYTMLSHRPYHYRPNNEAGLPVFGASGTACPPFGKLKVKKRDRNRQLIRIFRTGF
jgi:hypothetical protein